MNLFKKFVLHIFLMFAVFIHCQGQRRPITWKDFKLKGMVKEVNTSIVPNYPDTLKEKMLEYEYRNDIYLTEQDKGRLIFSDYGLLEVKHERKPSPKYENWRNAALYKSIYIYRHDRRKTTRRRKKFDGRTNEYPYPIEGIFDVLFDSESYWLGEDPDDPGYFKYVYKRNFFGRVKSLDERFGIKETINHSLGGKIKRFYNYDNEGRVASQDLKLKEKWKHRLFEFEMLHWMDISINSEVRYTFAYDAYDRMQEIKLYENNRVIWRETYSYPDTLTRRPHQLDRFIVASRTFAKHLTNNATEWYNPHGDIVKSVNYNNEGETVRTRFYEYNYDEQYNWVQCRMYLEGDPQKGEVPTLVVNREITYFPTETEGKKK